MQRQASIRSVNGRVKVERNVSFDSVDILEFKQVVGDNPCVSVGPPVALAPKLERRTSINLDVYEGTRKPRRNMIGMSMSCKDRERILKKNGEKQEDIVDAINQANSVKFYREQSFHSMEWDNLSELWEGTTRHVMRKIGLRSSAKKLFHETKSAQPVKTEESPDENEKEQAPPFRAGRRISSTTATTA